METNNDRVPKVDVKLLPHQLDNQKISGNLVYSKKKNLAQAGIILLHYKCHDSHPMFHLVDLMGNFNTLQLKLILAGHSGDRFQHIDYLQSFKLQFLNYKLVNDMTVEETWDKLLDKVRRTRYSESQGVKWEQIISSLKTLILAMSRLPILNNQKRMSWVAKRTLQIIKTILLLDFNVDLDTPLTNISVCLEKLAPLSIVNTTIIEIIYALEESKHTRLDFNSFQIVAYVAELRAEMKKEACVLLAYFLADDELQSQNEQLCNLAIDKFVNCMNQQEEDCRNLLRDETYKKVWMFSPDGISKSMRRKKLKRIRKLSESDIAQVAKRLRYSPPGSPEQTLEIELPTNKSPLRLSHETPPLSPPVSPQLLSLPSLHSLTPASDSP